MQLRAAALLALGAAPGDRIGWLLSNHEGHAALPLHHAILWLGGVSVPVNTRSSAAEVSAIMRRSGARLWIHADRLAKVAQDAAAALDNPPHIVGLAEFDRLAAGIGTPALRYHSGREGDDAAILFSSGTTGQPKGIVLTHANALAAGNGWRDAMGLTAEDVLQSPFPIFSGAGLHFNGLAIMCAGGTFVIDDYATEESLALVARTGATVYVAVPTIYQYWLAHGDMSSLTGLRALDYGGAMAATATIYALRQALPHVELIQTYGLTEAGPGGLVLPPRFALAKPGSVGNRGMWRHMDFRIVADNGRDVCADEPGEILLRGPSVMARYLDDPEQTAEAFHEGWLRTGDIARFDDEGFVYLLDRKKDLIIRGGNNVVPAEIENALLQHPAVLEAAVVGKPHPTLGEDIRAFVVLRPGHQATAEQLRQHLAGLVADYKVARDIVFSGDLPRNAAGKVLKRQLREIP